MLHHFADNGVQGDAFGAVDNPAFADQALDEVVGIQLGPLAELPHVDAFRGHQGQVLQDFLLVLVQGENTEQLQQVLVGQLGFHFRIQHLFTQGEDAVPLQSVHHFFRGLTAVFHMLGQQFDGVGVAVHQLDHLRQGRIIFFHIKTAVVLEIQLFQILHIFNGVDREGREEPGIIAPGGDQKMVTALQQRR